jgi:hypothetical protein
MLQRCFSARLLPLDLGVATTAKIKQNLKVSRLPATFFDVHIFISGSNQL